MHFNYKRITILGRHKNYKCECTEIQIQTEKTKGKIDEYKIMANFNISTWVTDRTTNQ